MTKIYNTLYTKLKVTRCFPKLRSAVIWGGREWHPFSNWILAIFNWIMSHSNSISQMPLLRKTKSFSYKNFVVFANQLSVRYHQMYFTCGNSTWSQYLPTKISVPKKKKKSSLLFTAKIHVVALLKQYINVGTKD